MNPRRLYRCRQDRQLAGVAAGIAEYLEIDPTVVRILWILSAFVGGFTILLYIILAFVMPLEPLMMPAPGPIPGADGTTEGAEATAATATADGTATASGWTGHQARTGNHAWTAPAHDALAGDRRGGRAGFVIGVLLVVFGAIALTGPLFPGWVAGAALGPAFLLALGVALVVSAARRPTPEP